ncbi:MAG TPA: hydroxyisourate hydrolase [Streptosporangiaceae bacterium]|jgi:5-hydroxyisourate hydrolase
MGVSTHVLDAATGRPAAGVDVRLEYADGDTYTEIGRGRTDADGRVRAWASGGEVTRPGTYRLVFATGAYFAAHDVAAFYPEVAIAFTVAIPDEPHHVPLLLSPYAYSTYRGS